MAPVLTSEPSVACELAASPVRVSSLTTSGPWMVASPLRYNSARRRCADRASQPRHRVSTERHRPRVVARLEDDHSRIRSARGSSQIELTVTAQGDPATIVVGLTEVLAGVVEDHVPSPLMLAVAAHGRVRRR